MGRQSCTPTQTKTMVHGFDDAEYPNQPNSRVQTTMNVSHLYGSIFSSFAAPVSSHESILYMSLTKFIYLSLDIWYILCCNWRVICGTWCIKSIRNEFDMTFLWLFCFSSLSHFHNSVWVHCPLGRTRWHFLLKLFFFFVVVNFWFETTHPTYVHTHI